MDNNYFSTFIFIDRDLNINTYVDFNTMPLKKYLTYKSLNPVVRRRTFLMKRVDGLLSRYKEIRYLAF